MINIYQPLLGKEELKAIKDVFDSNWLGYGRNGTKQDEFVKNLALSELKRINVDINEFILTNEKPVEEKHTEKELLQEEKKDGK